MTRERAPRGYTLTELVMAATLALVACLGGVTAVRVAHDANQHTESLRAVMAAVQRVERRSRGDGELRCALLQALKPSLPRGTCTELIAQEGEGSLPERPTVWFRLTIGQPAVAPGVVRVELEFEEEHKELMRHAFLLSLP